MIVLTSRSLLLLACSLTYAHLAASAERGECPLPSSMHGRKIEIQYDPERFKPKIAGDRGVPDASTLKTCSALSAICKPGECSMQRTLKGNKDTGHWGYFYEGLAPALIVQSGDVIEWELPTMVGHFAYDEMVKGDPGMASIVDPTDDGPAVPTIGATGAHDGAHWMSGPVYVCGAEPGDVLQIDILDLQPRSNPATGRSYGITASGGIGWHARAGYKAERGPHTAATVYEIVKDPASGEALYGAPLYQYITDDLDISIPCWPLEGSFPRTTEAGAADWANPDSTFGCGGRHVPCVKGKQTWGSGLFPPPLFSVPEKQRDFSIAGKFRTPINMHIGNIGTTPAVSVPVNSNAPFRTGGNFDNKRTGKGSTLYLPVEVTGALLMAGDGHAAMGDAELSGTGIEASLDSKVRITLHKAGSLPKHVQLLDYPLLETESEWIVNGLQQADYLRELEIPQAAIFEGPDLNRAFTVAFNESRDFMMHLYDLTENDVLSAMGVAVDFGTTQVVDGNTGVHAIIKKEMFESGGSKMGAAV